MQNLQALVATFHEVFGHPNHSKVHMGNLLDPNVAALRLKLLLEEINEGKEAATSFEGEVEKSNIVNIFDALLDVAVITLGTACTYGLRLDSSNPTVELLENLYTAVSDGGLFDTLQNEFNKLEQNLTNLHTYPNTQSYLASAVLRNLQDLLDKCVGLSSLLNFPFELGFLEVHASNMSKLGEDGQPIYREDGKILKGPNYFKPDLEKILDTHFAEST